MAPLLNENGVVDSDPWQQIFTEEELEAGAALTKRHLILPLGLWRQHAQRLTEQGNSVGVWLGPDDEPEELVSALDALPVVAIHFPKFTDGRGYTQAKILRERYRYAGDLRATGDILRDIIYLLHQCGFGSFALRADLDVEEALGALRDYSWSPMVGR